MYGRPVMKGVEDAIKPTYVVRIHKLVCLLFVSMRKQTLDAEDSD